MVVHRSRRLAPILVAMIAALIAMASASAEERRRPSRDPNQAANLERARHMREAQATGTRTQLRTDEAAGISIEFPGAWKLQSDSNTTTAMDPKEEAVTMLITTDSDNMKKVGDAVDAELATILTKVEWGPQEQVSFYGMAGILMRGSALSEGKPVANTCLIFVSPKKKGVFVLAIVEESKVDAHADELNGIFKSIKPL